MKLFTKVTDRTLGVTALLAIVILVFVTLSVTYEVVMRYFLDRPTLWVFEITQICLLYFTFLGAAWVLKKEGHVKIDLVLNSLKPRAQTWVNIITSGLATIAWLIVAWYGGWVTWQHFQLGLAKDTLMDIPDAPILAIIPVGSLLLFVQCLRRTSDYVRHDRTSLEPKK